MIVIINFDYDECRKIRRRKKLDIIDFDVMFIIIFRIVNDFVVNNIKSYHFRIVTMFVLLFDSMM